MKKIILIIATVSIILSCFFAVGCDQISNIGDKAGDIYDEFAAFDYAYISTLDGEYIKIELNWYGFYHEAGFIILESKDGKVYLTDEKNCTLVDETDVDINARVKVSMTNFIDQVFNRAIISMTDGELLDIEIESTYINAYSVVRIVTKDGAKYYVSYDNVILINE